MASSVGKPYLATEQRMKPTTVTQKKQNGKSGQQRQLHQSFMQLMVGEEDIAPEANQKHSQSQWMLPENNIQSFDGGIRYMNNHQPVSSQTEDRGDPKRFYHNITTNSLGTSGEP